MNKIPIYEAILQGDDCGIYAISIVDEPATEVQMQLFNNETQRSNFSVQDEEKRVVFSVIMLADTPIYRYTREMGEFYVKFSAETLREMCQRYLKNGFQNNVNFNHSDKWLYGIEMFEIFQSDKERGINPKGFEDCADGSIFASFKVVDDTLWNEIKNGNYKGFSFETIFALETAKYNKADESEALLDEIITLLEKIKK